MPRPLRYPFPGVPQHLVQRGNNRQATFFCDDDRAFYLDCLGEAASRYGLLVHAYVLMSNHVHLLATPSDARSIARTLQSVGRRYVQHVNRGHDRSGTLWEGRHKASIIDSELYLASCHAYIELNPVRAGMVRDPAGYRWSSCRHYVSGVPDGVLSAPLTYTSLGETPEERARAHHRWLLAGLDPEVTADIRVSTAQGGVVGGNEFRQRVEAVLNRRTPCGRRGRPCQGAGN